MERDIHRKKILDETCEEKNPVTEEELLSHFTPEELIRHYTNLLWEMTEKLIPPHSPSDTKVTIQISKSHLIRLGLADEITDREESQLRQYQQGNRNYNTVTIHRDPNAIYIRQIYKLHTEDVLANAQLPVGMDYQLAEDLTLSRDENTSDISAQLLRGKRLQRIHIADVTSPDLELPFHQVPVQILPSDLQRVHDILTERINPQHDS